MFKKIFAFLVLLIACEQAPAAEAALKTRNVFLITTDGFRWLDLFNGADPALTFSTNGGIARSNVFKQAFWRKTPEARREALMPFFWNTIAKQGQLFGNQKKGSIVHVTNKQRISYPGYNEILTGSADERISGNDPIPNPNVTVLEWLNRKPAWTNQVAVYSAWNLMRFAINRERGGFPVMSGWESVPDHNPSPRQSMVNELIGDVFRENEKEAPDALLYQAAKEHLLLHQPRVFFVSFLETDSWGHQGHYDRILHAAHKVDDYIRRLWETAQSLPQYRDQTTFIITTDHGRGMAPREWKHHSDKLAGSENIWLAVLGPDTPPLGERVNSGTLTQSQIAATIAAFLGEDYHAAVPKAGEAIADVFPSAKN